MPCRVNLTKVAALVRERRPGGDPGCPSRQAVVPVLVPHHHHIVEEAYLEEAQLRTRRQTRPEGDARGVLRVRARDDGPPSSAESSCPAAGKSIRDIPREFLARRRTIRSMAEDALSSAVDEVRVELGPELTRLLDAVQSEDLASLDAAWEAILAEVLGED